MIDRLASTLREAGFDFDAPGLLDALWLARYVVPPVQPVRAAGFQPETEGEQRGGAEAAPLAASGSAERQAQPTGPEEPPVKAGGSVYAGGITGSAEPTVPASPIRIPAGTAIPEGLDIVRALRVLPARRDSRTHYHLDEEATVDNSARAFCLAPVVRPVRERWFEAALVVEHSPSMEVWTQTIVEVERLLGCLGVFRDLRVWWLDAGPEARLTSPGGRQARLEALRDANARRIVFVFTHAVSEAWSKGWMGQALNLWGRSTPVVLLHALPPSMWKETALGEPRGLARNSTPGGPNTELRYRSAWWDRMRKRPISGMVFPVFHLDRTAARRWAEMLMARRGATAPAYLIEAASKLGTPALAGAPPPLAGEPDAETRVAMFKAHASEDAFRLAVHLAAGPVTVPVLHLVQSAVLGGRARNSQIAEVMLSGLVERVTPMGAAVPPDQVQFRFDAQVRSILLRSLRADDARSLADALQNYIEKQFGSRDSFSSWLRDPKGKTLIPASAEPFAELRAGFLQWLGVDYTPVAPKTPLRKDVYALIVCGERNDTLGFEYRLPGAAWAAYEFGKYLKREGVPKENIFEVSHNPKEFRDSFFQLQRQSGTLLIVFWYGRAWRGDRWTLYLPRVGEEPAAEDESGDIGMEDVAFAAAGLRFPEQILMFSLVNGPISLVKPGLPAVVTPVTKAPAQTILAKQIPDPDNQEGFWPPVHKVLQEHPDYLFADVDWFAQEFAHVPGVERPAFVVPSKFKRLISLFWENLVPSEFDVTLHQLLQEAGAVVYIPPPGERTVEQTGAGEIFITVQRDPEELERSQHTRAVGLGKPVMVVVPPGGFLPDDAPARAYPVFTFHARPRWDRRFADFVLELERLSDSEGELHDVPELPNPYLERRTILETIAERLNKAPSGSLWISGQGERTACAGFARLDATRRRYKGGIFWLKSVPGSAAFQVPAGPHLLIAPAEAGRYMGAPPPNQQRLFYGEAGSWSLRLLRLSRQESDELLSRGLLMPTVIPSEDLERIWQVHDGDLYLLLYIMALLTELNDAEVLAVFRTQSEQIAQTPKESRLDLLRVSVALPSVSRDSYNWTSLWLLYVAWHRQMPVALAASMDVNLFRFQKLRFTTTPREGWVALAEDIRKRLDSMASEADLAKSHQTILEFEDRARTNTPPHWVANDGYYHQSRIYHLVGARREKEAYNLLFDLDWLAARGEQEGREGILLDLSQVPEDLDVRTLAMRIRDDEEYLDDVFPGEWPDALGRVVTGFPLAPGSSRMARLREQAGPAIQRYVVVVGTSNLGALTPSDTWAAQALGGALAREQYGLITGGWPGVDAIAAEAYLRGGGSKLVQVLEEGSPATVDSRARIVHTPAGSGLGTEVGRADAIVLIGGRGGGERASRLANIPISPRSRKRIVLPIPETGGDARQVYERLLPRGYYGMGNQSEVRVSPPTSFAGVDEAERSVRQIIRTLARLFGSSFSPPE